MIKFVATNSLDFDALSSLSTNIISQKCFGIASEWFWIDSRTLIHREWAFIHILRGFSRGSLFDISPLARHTEAVGGRYEGSGQRRSMLWTHRNQSWKKKLLDIARCSVGVLVCIVSRSVGWIADKTIYEVMNPRGLQISIGGSEDVFLENWELSRNDSECLQNDCTELSTWKHIDKICFGHILWVFRAGTWLPVHRPLDIEKMVDSSSGEM